MVIVVDVFFLFGRWETSLPLSKNCGMNLAGISAMITDPSAGKLGPLVCGSSFSELTIPAASAAGNSGSLAFSALQIAPEEIEKGRQIKEVSLKTAMGVFFSLAIIFLLLGFFLIFLHFRNAGASHTEAAGAYAKEPSCAADDDSIDMAPVASPVGPKSEVPLEV